MSLTVVKDANPFVGTFRPRPTKGVFFMASHETNPASADVERVPTMQRILDNHFLLLFLGITIPTVLYVLWGVMEVASIPIGPPPG